MLVKGNWTDNTRIKKPNSLLNGYKNIPTLPKQ